MRLREWLATPEIESPAIVADDETPAAAVRPIPAIGSAEYRRASLERKFWIATSVRVPGAMALQRELQTAVRARGVDPWAAATLLMRIEAAAREVPA